VNPLRQKIEQEIREGGAISFSRYMELCLYDEKFGYYSRNTAQFGKAGDFYTSSDVHAVFGRLMARQFEEMWRVMGSPERIVVKELGPGRGLFAQDVLDWSEKKFPEFFAALRYVLVERSPALRERIEQTLGGRVESGKAAIESPGHKASGAKARIDDRTSTAALKRRATPDPALAGASEAQLPFPTIIFANEFFDALPVEIVSAQGSLRVDCRDGRLVETWVPVSSEELEYLERYSIHPEADERVEAPLEAQRQVRAACGFERGFVVIIDYGYTREEQLAGRHRGTVKAIRQHAVSASPYEAPGEQDVTADVNFTALAVAAEQCGMRAHRLVTQSQFLMGIGEANQFADAFEDCRLPQERTKVALQLKHLVTPAGMGESFHALVASKGVEREKAEALAGLSFGRR
jgi:SAM-dependent MidA family methyltransferase